MDKLFYSSLLYLQHYQSPLFGIIKSKGGADEVSSLPESQALCLPVSIEELLHANELGAVRIQQIIVCLCTLYVINLFIVFLLNL